MTTKSTVEEITASLSDISQCLELQFRGWLVERLKAWDEMPDTLKDRIAEGATSSNIEAACIRVMCDGITGDEDTADRDRYAVNCTIMVLFDWKAFDADTFKAAMSIVQRAIRALDFEIAFQDITGIGGEAPFYWLPNVSGLETDILTIDSEFWDSPAGRTYNHATFRFTMFFLKSESVTGIPIYNPTGASV